MGKRCTDIEMQNMAVTMRERILYSSWAEEHTALWTGEARRGLVCGK
jgi:hypothetical protein